MSRFAPAPVRHLYDDALAVLLAWSAPDETREQLRRGFLSALAADPMAVSKTGPSAHLTASTLVLSEDGEWVLLHLHRRAQQWMQFGGHLEHADGSVWDAASREVTEESGLDGLRVLPDPIDLDRHALGARFGACSEHLDIRYLALARAGLTALASDESDDIGWFPADSLPPQVPADMPRLVEIGRRRLARV